MRKIWSTSDIEYLKNNYETATKEQLCSILNTSWDKIKDKATKLGGINRQKIKCDVAAVLADYSAAMPLAELWAKHDISNPTLRILLKKHNIAGRNNSLAELKDIETFKLDYQTLPINDISAKYGVSNPTVTAKARELNLIRPRALLYNRSPFLAKEQEICDKYVNAAKSMAMLATEYLCSIGTIFQILHKNNVEVRPVNQYGAAETGVRTWLKEVTGLDFITNRTVLEGKEIDMYNADMKIGLEYCGLFWHCDYFPKKDRTYHYDKFLLAKQKGVQLVTMFEDEWINRQEQVKGALLSILHKNTRKLHGRKCTVKTIDKALGNKFYDDYHIQGKANLGQHYAGLYYLDELVGVMSFGLHHRDITKHTLDRLCFKTGVSVAGGSNKLFKFLLDTTGITELISWSDNRWFQGQVYEKLGFKKDQDMKPDYSYVDIKDNLRLSKQSQKKSNSGCPENITEKDWSIKKGLYRMWDCGKTRWTYTKDN